MTWVSGVLSDGPLPGSPAKRAMTPWLPTASVFVLQIAVRVLPLPVSVTTLQPGIVLPLSMNAMLPVGFAPMTVAVNVTVMPTSAGFAELTSVVDVGAAPEPPAAATAAPASTIPAPQIAVVQSRPVPVGNGRAVVCRIDI